MIPNFHFGRPDQHPYTPISFPHRKIPSSHVLPAPNPRRSDHFLWVNGIVGGHDALMFLDTGLVTLDPRGNQPAGGIRREALENWDVAFADGFTESVMVSIGPASHDVSSFSVFQDGRNFASLGDTTPDVLISHGFFKHYVWTMDFDERKLYLRPTTSHYKGASQG